MKKPSLLIMLLFSLVLLCGCGIELSSKMQINESFSGSRNISCSISSSDLNNNFKGTKKDLDDIIQKSCPSAFSYTKKNDGNDYRYYFKLSFSSKKEYTKHVRSLLHFAPKITYRYQDSPFSSGLVYKENFTSKDLMAWLYTALYEKDYIDKDSADKIWDMQDTTFIFKGKKYNTKDQIAIDESQCNPVSSISLHTTETGKRSYQRTISISIPQETLDKKSQSISQYFSGKQFSWKASSNGKIMVFHINGVSFTEICKKTADILHISGSNASYRSLTKAKNPFSFYSDYEETLNMKNFLDESGTVPVTYTFTNSLGKRKTILKDAISKKKLNFSSSFQQKVQHYQVITVYKNKNEIRRQFSFHFDSICTKSDITRLKEAFVGKTISNVSVEKEKTMVLRFYQKGTVAACSSDIQKIFGKSSISYGSVSSVFRGTSSELEEKWDFHLNSQAVGTYYFVSVSEESTTGVTVTPKKNQRKLSDKNSVDRNVASLLEASENTKSICKYKINGGSFCVVYQGNTSANYLWRIFKFFIPLLLIVGLSIFVYVKQNFIIRWLQKAKDKIENILDSH